MSPAAFVVVFALRRILVVVDIGNQAADTPELVVVVATAVVDIVERTSAVVVVGTLAASHICHPAAVELVDVAAVIVKSIGCLCSCKVRMNCMTVDVTDRELPSQLSRGSVWKTANPW